MRKWGFLSTRLLLRRVEDLRNMQERGVYLPFSSASERDGMLRDLKMILRERKDGERNV